MEPHREKKRKVKRFNLADYIESCLIPQNTLKQQNVFDDIFAGVNSGNCGLFVDTLSVGFDIDVKGFKQRSITKPENEVVIKGSHEAFVENLRTNTSLIRRFTNNENLVIEYRGLLDEEDSEEYPGYHYYDVTIFNRKPGETPYIF